MHYAMTHGLVYASTSLEGDASRATQCPGGLLPLKVPAHAFEKAVSLSPLWNILVDAVARQPEWLYKILEAAGRADPFTGRLVEVCKNVRAEAGGLRQSLYLGINRSDYMMHEPTDVSVSEARFLQVELNTIASSFGALASRTSGLHRFLLGRYGTGSSPVAGALREHYGVRECFDLDAQIPENFTLQHIPDALSQAFELYCSGIDGGAANAIVLFVVQEGERNFADQRWFEYALWERSGCRVVRKTLREVASECRLDETSGRLSLHEDGEVAVAYFRAGYIPDDYPSEVEWQGRLLLERSLAIKCPSVAYQLVGAKKVQQALARPGALEEFLSSADSIQLRESFAGLWGLGPGEGDAEIVAEAMNSPERFVMKPQREGGGNNIYGDDIPNKLNAMSPEERGAFIMMQRILPKTQEAVMTRTGSAIVTPSLSEFGFYSVFIGDGKDIHLNKHAGHLSEQKLKELMKEVLPQAMQS
jgi:glutathione synthase